MVGFAAELELIVSYLTDQPKAWVTDDNSFAMEMALKTKEDFSGLPATGKCFSIKTCSFGEFENGKIKGRRDYWNFVT